jgi:two-component system sensor histidine kinase AlgZ
MKKANQWFGILLGNLAIACIPVLLVLAIDRDITLHKLWINFCFSLVFTNCIGTIASFTIPRVWRGVCVFESVWLRWVIRLGTLFAVSSVGTLIACLFLMAVGWLSSTFFWQEYWSSLRIATLITLAVSGVITMYETMQARLNETTLQLRTKELERERALKLATEAQLASLESRIHPHFLFNTLNSISSLIPEDPARAERLVERMAALLRFSLDSNQAGLVSLASELKIVGDYLEIERARFGDRLRYRIDVASQIDESRLPPLSLQTLVENSVKFAIAPNRAGGEIRIAGVRDNGLLRLEISDDGPAFALESAPAGHGLDNLKGRLETLFGKNAALTVERLGNRNSVRLSVPQVPNGHQSVSS